MAADSDGYALNARIRSPDSVPTTLMLDLIATLEWEMRHAATGSPVMLSEWVAWARKSKAHTNALIRLLFLVAAINGMSADQVHELQLMMRDTAERRRRPPQRFREPGERKSPQLW